MAVDLLVSGIRQNIFREKEGAMKDWSTDFDPARLAAELTPDELRAEVWKPVAGVAEFYEVSDMGRVRTWWRTGRRKPFDWRTSTPRVLALRISSNGYAKVRLTNARKEKAEAWVHRLVAEAFHGSALPFAQANHIDGCKTNNRITNLEWSTPSENAQHRELMKEAV